MKTLDTRELQERLSELELFRDALNDAREQSELIRKDPDSTEAQIEEADDREREAELDFGQDEANELKELEELKEEIGGEWRHGVTLIPESDFEDYARELAEDTGAIEPNMAWPMNCIDWAQAAKELAMDYSSTTFQGEDYLYRA